jgi:branched-chain amino acid transport system permease protein
VQAAAVPRRRRLPAWWPWAAGALLLLLLPWLPGLHSNFGRSLLSQMAIAAVFALSYNMLIGQTGLLSFGHAVYFGLGGYAAIHVLRMINGGWPIPVLAVPLFGALGGLLFGILIGSVTTRRGGTVFAMITLGLGELVVAASLIVTIFFGGEEGITANRTRGPAPFGLTLTTQLQVYYVLMFWFLAAAALMYAFTRTPAGRMCNAVRDNAERAEFIGYNPVRVRFIAFVLAAMFAGVAGGMHAINYEIVAAEALGASRSGTVLLMTYIGGVGHFLGPVLGAAVITWLQVSLSDYTSAWQLYFGLIFIAMVLYAPGGLAGLIALHAPLVRARTLGPVLGAYALMLVPVVAMLLGMTWLLETAYRTATQPELGGKMKLFGIAFDAYDAWPWAAGLLVAAAGYVAFRRAWRLVAGAWQAAAPAGARER